MNSCSTPHQGCLLKLVSNPGILWLDCASYNPSNAEATFVSMHKNAKIYENHRSPVVLVLIGKLSPSTLRWVPICQGFSNFSGFLHYFILAKLAISSIRFKMKICGVLHSSKYFCIDINNELSIIAQNHAFVLSYIIHIFEFSIQWFILKSVEVHQAQRHSVHCICAERIGHCWISFDICLLQVELILLQVSVEW